APVARITGRTCSSRYPLAVARQPKKSAPLSRSLLPNVRATQAARLLPLTPGCLREGKHSERELHATSDDGRWNQALLRRNWQRLPYYFSPGISRRLPPLRTASSPLFEIYRCVTFNARGYPPSDVPSDGERYSQERARNDIRSVLDALNIDKAHIVGL